ncbi:hypothetical protein LG634_02825 [Streptomyces bambusae]|uniref:hypothetical protein n=1 Tax=Streptomyces bambusae TaxID=1550616 RepID=UPI001CFC60F1|nr:hypothetical protein [Streptomyces bambusae]MCB5163778.1 hypothetical protein [Streptomyces bambusae]
MTRTPALNSTVARPARRRIAVTATALAALALVGCGTARSGDLGPQGTSARGVGVRHDADAGGSGREAAFGAMLDRMAQGCPQGGGPVGPPTPPPYVDPETGEVWTAAPEAPLTGPEAELDARDWCASARHEERIAQALWDLEDPTPAQVRRILNGLDYPDDRIHDLKRSGPATRFLLDLRTNGGRLCLKGTAAGEDTVVDKCVAPVTGPFTAAGR